MKSTFVYKAAPERAEIWARLFSAKAPEIDFRVWPDIGDPAHVRYLAAWEPPDNISESFPNLEILFSVAAGVDHFDLADVPAHVPLVRMTEPGIAESMAEYVMHAVLSVHRHAFEYEDAQSRRAWQPLPVRPASEVRVGVLGLGGMARAALERLVRFGYPCAAWSRSRHAVDGIACFAGPEGMAPFLARTDVLVCLLPLTSETRGILNERLLSQLPRGSSLVQVGRGGHLDQDALLRMLDSEHIASARLDVTDPEPLPPEHPLWRHPRVRITPHVASSTRPQTGFDMLLQNIRRHHAGEPMVGVVDRSLGY